MRSQAIRSAGWLAEPAHLPDIIAQLGDPITGADATETLVRYGAPLIQSLESYSTASTSDLTVRRSIPGVAARITGIQSVNFLLQR